MAPKDIRSFFSVKSATKKKKPADTDSTTLVDADQPVSKKAKTNTAASPGSAVKSEQTGTPIVQQNKSHASSKKKQSSTEKLSTRPSSTGSKKAPAKASPSAKRKRTLAISDSEDEWNGGDASGKTDDSEIVLVCSSDSENPLAKKSVSAKVPPSEKPAAKRKAAAAAKAAKPKMEFTPHKSAAGDKADDTTPASGGRSLPKSLTKPAAADTVKAAAAASGTPKQAAKPRGKAKNKDPLAEQSEDVCAAIAAVDAAAAKLPDQEALAISVMEATGDGGGFGMTKPPDDPPRAGSKVAPEGHPDCLMTKTFVVTGVLDSLRRPDADDLVKRHGGRVTGSVSSKTSFLLAGHQCGRSKMASAKEKGTKVIDEDGLFALIASTQHIKPRRASNVVAELTQPTPALPAASGAPAARSSAPARLMGPPHTGSHATVPGSSGATAAAAAAAARKAKEERGGQLWVEKHKPQTSQELVGNATTILTLRQWLREWHAVHILGHTPSAAKGRSKDTSKKAVLISGSPGIGKSSSALILARELGFLPIEVNASDTRNKADGQATVKAGINGKLANSIKELATNTTISADGRPQQTVLIMDEVDGMSAGDRGGVADLIQTIHASKVPIIAICNDKYHQKLKSLRNHCLELEFRKPTAQQISARMMAICRKEGLQLNDATMRSLVESASGDLRLVLGQLQMIRLRTTALSYDDAKRHGGNQKDEIMSPFEAARKLLDADASRMRLGDQIDLVFQDMDLVPLLIQENYLNHRPQRSGNEMQQMQLVAKAADALSLGDGATKKVRMQQTWTLMPFACVIGSVFPATYVRGQRYAFGLHPGEMNFPRFSGWFGANSSSGKQRRLLGELHTRMTASSNFHSDRSTLRLQYAPALRRTLTKPLELQGDSGVPAVIEGMHQYCMSREDLDYVMDVTKFKTKSDWNPDPMASVPTALKSAFTRAFNKDKVAPRTNIMAEAFTRKGGKKSGMAAGKGKKTPSASAGGEGALRESEEEAAEQNAAQQGEEDAIAEQGGEENDPEALQRRLANSGVAFSAAPKTKKGSSGRGRGRSGGSAASGGRGSGQGGRGRGSR